MDAYAVEVLGFRVKGFRVSKRNGGMDACNASYVHTHNCPVLFPLALPG